VGHGLCAAACPTGAIALTLGDLSDRRDLPALNEDLEAVGVPGLFLAGELGGFALVRTAVTQGAAAADAVAGRGAAGNAAGFGRKPDSNGTVDLLVVGAGPAGLSCSLRARELGLDFVTIEQEDRIGGTVAGYPRRKLVMTDLSEGGARRVVGRPGVGKPPADPHRRPIARAGTGARRRLPGPNE
jgi:NADPH-dependent glutamate synthase beta subunit-like oxidoreductase